MANWAVFQPSKIQFLESGSFVEGFSQGQKDATALEDALRRWRKDDQSYAQQETRHAQDTMLKGQRIQQGNEAADERATGAAAKELNSPQGKAVYESLRAEAEKRGYENPTLAAQALTANIYEESRFNVGARNPNDKGKESIGMMQWRGDRNAALRSFASEQGKDWRDLGIQTQHLFNELDTTEKAAGARLRAAKDSSTAMNAAMGFIRFEGYDDPGHGQYRKRMSNFGAIGGIVEQNKWGSASAGATSAGAEGEPTTGETSLPPTRPTELLPPPASRQSWETGREPGQSSDTITPYPASDPDKLSAGLERRLRRAQAENPVETYEPAPNATGVDEFLRRTTPRERPYIPNATPTERFLLDQEYGPLAEVP